MTKNKAQRGTAVKRAEEKEAQFQLFGANSSVGDLNLGVKGRNRAPPGHTRISRSRQLRRDGVPAGSQ